MRIGMMTDTYKPHISGVTNYIETNKRSLESLGHEVYVFTFGDHDFPDDEKNIFRSAGVPLIDTGFYFNFQYNPTNKKILQTMDVVHVHHPFLSGRLALRYCRALNIPIIFTNHTRYDLYLQTYVPILSESMSEALLQAYLPSFCRAVNLVISPSAGMKGVLQRLGVDAPIEVIPNGVDLRRFSGPFHKKCREDFGFTRDEILLVYTGRLAAEKNLPFLFQTFAGLRQAYPNVRLLVIGTGSEIENLKNLAYHLGIQEVVVFTGLVGYHDLPGYLAMCDIFLTASITEVHPLSIIEAMAVGLPVLGIDSPGIADTIQDGVNGLLSKENMAAFTAKCSRLVTDPVERKKLGQAAQITAETYAIERTSRLVLEKYLELVSLAAPSKRGINYRIRSLMESWKK